MRPHTSNILDDGRDCLYQLCWMRLKSGWETECSTLPRVPARLRSWQWASLERPDS
jgi:hypothetical protein